MGNWNGLGQDGPLHEHMMFLGKWNDSAPCMARIENKIMHKPRISDDSITTVVSPDDHLLPNAVTV